MKVGEPTLRQALEVVNAALERAAWGRPRPEDWDDEWVLACWTLIQKRVHRADDLEEQALHESYSINLKDGGAQ